jgi:PII-like signaling protein
MDLQPRRLLRIYLNEWDQDKGEPFYEAMVGRRHRINTNRN